MRKSQARIKLSQNYSGPATHPVTLQKKSESAEYEKNPHSAHDPLFSRTSPGILIFWGQFHVTPIQQFQLSSYLKMSTNGFQLLSFKIPLHRSYHEYNLVNWHLNLLICKMWLYK